MDNDGSLMNSLSGLACISELGSPCDVELLLADRQAPGASAIAAPHKTRPLNWPTLEQLRMGAAEQSARSTGIGGSDANIILSGERDKIVQLWREKRKEVEPPDLSDSLL